MSRVDEPEAPEPGSFFAPPVETRPEDFGRLFLRYPELFPARPAGEPWGDETVAVDFAGGPYVFTGLCRPQAAELGRRFGPMVLEAPPREATSIRLFRADPAELKDVDLRGWSYTFDRDYQAHAVRVAGLHFMARVDFEPVMRGALWTPFTDGSYFLAQVENFFRLLVGYRLLDLGGVLFHSAGAASAGRGYLFLGHSGAGKTTISRKSLAEGREVLSDDMNALCPLDDSGRPAVEKLPFAGDLGRIPSPRRRFPLHGLFRLRKGEPRIAPLSRSQAVAFLIGCAPFVNVDPFRIERLTDNLTSLLGHHPLAELTFAKDRPVWPLLEPGSSPAKGSTS